MARYAIGFHFVLATSVALAVALSPTPAPATPLAVVPDAQFFGGVRVSSCRTVNTLSAGEVSVDADTCDRTVTNFGLAGRASASMQTGTTLSDVKAVASVSANTLATAKASITFSVGAVSLNPLVGFVPVHVQENVSGDVA